MVKEMNDSLFREKIYDYLKGEKPQLVNKNNTILEFYTVWCPHCKSMKPRLKALSEIYSDINFYSIDLEKYPELAELFEVESFPTFIFIDKNGLINKWVGEVQESELDGIIKKTFDL